MRSRPEEGDLERWARAIVSHHTKLRVDRGDDGLVDGQPDGLIVAPGGVWPLEVVSDTDGAYEALEKTLSRNAEGFDMPGDPGTIIWVGTQVVIRSLARLLPSTVPTLDFGETDILWGGALPDVLSRAGVVGAQRPGGVPGRVLVTHEGWNSWDDTIDFVGWVHRVLARNPDVATKLERFGGIRQHAFIWARPSSAWSAGTMLRDDETHLPSHRPDLPRQVTDLWIASTYRASVLWRSPEAGWARLSRTGIPGVR